jgi:hypothetical protein
MREALEAGNLVGPRLFVSPPLWEGNRLFYSFARTLRTPEVADAGDRQGQGHGRDFLKSYVRAPIPIMAKIAQGALDLGVPSGTHMIAPGAAAGIAGTTHLSATQRMGYGWSKSAAAITYQDAYDLHGKGGFHLIDTLFSALALAGQDPGIVTDRRFILVPPNFVTGLQNATADARPARGANDATQQAKVAAGRPGGQRHRLAAGGAGHRAAPEPARGRHGARQLPGAADVTINAAKMSRWSTRTWARWRWASWPT